jgi:ankyrin repeat protein
MASTLKLPAWVQVADAQATLPQPLNPAIEAARQGAAGAMDKAIRDKADVNMPDATGMTALHHAAARGARGCIRVLVNSGQCDYLAQDNEGRYASDIALEGARDYAVARLLLRKQVQQAHRTAQPAYIRPSDAQKSRSKGQGR